MIWAAAHHPTGCSDSMRLIHPTVTLSPCSGAPPEIFQRRECPSSSLGGYERNNHTDSRVACRGPSPNPLVKLAVKGGTLSRGTAELCTRTLLFEGDIVSSTIGLFQGLASFSRSSLSRLDDRQFSRYIRRLKSADITDEQPSPNNPSVVVARPTIFTHINLRSCGSFGGPSSRGVAVQKTSSTG